MATQVQWLGDTHLETTKTIGDISGISLSIALSKSSAQTDI